MEPLIISVAVTGGEHGREATPHLPITPEEIARSAHEAYEAGASIVHLHVRDDDGVPGHFLDRYRLVMDYLGDRCDMIVNLTTDPGGIVEGDARFRSLDLGPELATLDAGTMQAPTGDRIVEGSLPFLRRLAGRMLETGTKPELEIFHSGMIRTCLQLAEEGLLEPPLYFQFVLGAAGYAPGIPGELLGLLGQIPPGSPWSVAGIGRTGVAMTMMGIIASSSSTWRPGRETGTWCSSRSRATAGWTSSSSMRAFSTWRRSPTFPPSNGISSWT